MDEEGVAGLPHVAVLDGDGGAGGVGVVETVEHLAGADLPAAGLPGLALDVVGDAAGEGVNRSVLRADENDFLFKVVINVTSLVDGGTRRVLANDGGSVNGGVLVSAGGRGLGHFGGAGTDNVPSIAVRESGKFHAAL